MILVRFGLLQADMLVNEAFAGCVGRVELNDLARQSLSVIIRTSEHFHVFSTLLRLGVRMFGSGGKKRANTSSNCAAL
jgi:hypothetical protein